MIHAFTFDCFFFFWSFYSNIQNILVIHTHYVYIYKLLHKFITYEHFICNRFNTAKTNDDILFCKKNFNNKYFYHNFFNFNLKFFPLRLDIRQSIFVMSYMNMISNAEQKQKSFIVIILCYKFVSKINKTKQEIS